MKPINAAVHNSHVSCIGSFSPQIVSLNGPPTRSRNPCAIALALCIGIDVRSPPLWPRILLGCRVSLSVENMLAFVNAFHRYLVCCPIHTLMMLFRPVVLRQPVFLQPRSRVRSSDVATCVRDSSVSCLHGSNTKCLVVEVTVASVRQ
jgi:hypothetical protein